MTYTAKTNWKTGDSLTGDDINKFEGALDRILNTQQYPITSFASGVTGTVYVHKSGVDCQLAGTVTASGDDGSAIRLFDLPEECTPSMQLFFPMYYMYNGQHPDTMNTALSIENEVHCYISVSGEGEFRFNVKYTCFEE